MVWPVRPLAGSIANPEAEREMTEVWSFVGELADSEVLNRVNELDLPSAWKVACQQAMVGTMKMTD